MEINEGIFVSCNSRGCLQNIYGNFASFFFQAEAYMGLGEWGKAETLLRKILETDSESATVALYQLSQVCMSVYSTNSNPFVINHHVGLNQQNM